MCLTSSYLSSIIVYSAVSLLCLFARNKLGDANTPLIQVNILKDTRKSCVDIAYETENHKQSEKFSEAASQQWKPELLCQNGEKMIQTSHKTCKRLHLTGG